MTVRRSLKHRVLALAFDRKLIRLHTCKARLAVEFAKVQGQQILYSFRSCVVLAIDDMQNAQRPFGGN